MSSSHLLKYVASPFSNSHILLGMTLMKGAFQIVISSGIWIALSFSQVLCMWCILDKLAMTTDSCVLHDNIS